MRKDLSRGDTKLCVPLASADGPNAADNRTPLAIARHGTADEVAGLVAYLAFDAAAFVTGAVYNIDGGWSA